MKSIKHVRVAALLAAILLLVPIFAACDGAENGTETPETTAGSDAGGTSGEGADALPALWNTATHTENKSFGEGAKTVEVEVVADGYSVTFTVKTDEDRLGAALLAHGIVAGDEGPYGLYITAVNGIVADYSDNQAWWSLSREGESLMTGVDTTPVENGAHYELTYKIG